jgi:hypothetical protein
MSILELEGSLWIDYTNHRGERVWRHILPSYIWYGISKYHEGKQWFIISMDLDKMDTRCFALSSIHKFSSEEVKDGVVEGRPGHTTTE